MLMKHELSLLKEFKGLIYRIDTMRNGGRGFLGIGLSWKVGEMAVIGVDDLSVIVDISSVMGCLNHSHSIRKTCLNYCVTRVFLSWDSA